MADKTEKSPKSKKQVIYIVAAVCLVAAAVVCVYFATRSNKGAPETTAEPQQTAEDITVPQSTEPAAKTKNYTFYIDMLKYDSVEEDGVTKLTAKDGSGAVMTVAPVPKAYAEYCEMLASELGKGEKLPIAAENSGFGNAADNASEIAYCVDDGNGGCIEIRYSVPEGDTAHRSEFEVMLTMFKIV